MERETNLLFACCKGTRREKGTRTRGSHSIHFSSNFPSVLNPLFPLFSLTVGDLHLILYTITDHLRDDIHVTLSSSSSSEHVINSSFFVYHALETTLYFHIIIKLLSSFHLSLLACNINYLLFVRF